MTHMEYVIGIDLGTQGCRVLAVTSEGHVGAAASQPLSPAGRDLPAGWFEQDPLDWWQAAAACLRQVIGGLPAGALIAGVCVTSTSGTILPVDSGGKPLHPALMYNDQRSEPQAQWMQSAAQAHQQRFGFVFGSSFALPKILWFKQSAPEVYSRTAHFIHAADFISGRLSGNYAVSDTSNALKTGYDLLDFCWPDFIEHDLGIPLDRLSRIVLPGTVTGQVTSDAAAETGLPAGTPLMAGATDGTAAQIASGAAAPGDWNSTLGTTLVFKGVSRVLKPDPLGRVYFHRHPEGWWMPGGASNTGTDWMLHDHPGADLNELNRQAAACLPTNLVRYPLSKHGERFPFLHPSAQGFCIGAPAGPIESYASGLEGVALVECLAYEMLESIGLEVGEQLFLTGGGSKSEILSQVRATLLNRKLFLPTVTETAFGAAVIAASGCWHATLSQAARSMVKIEKTIEPVPGWRAAYEEKFSLFKTALISKGYISAG